MDGSIYLDIELFDGTHDFLNYVKSIEGRYIFLTNNSSKGVDKYIEKLDGMGIKATGFSKEDTVLLEDRLYTDIACGVNAGISTVFVLSGEGTLEDIEKSDTKPEFIYKNIKKVYEDLI